MGPTEISIIVGTLAFVVLVIFIAKFLHATCKTMHKITETLEGIQHQIDDLGDQPQEFFHHSNELLADINYKLSCLDPLFRSVENVGEKLECKTGTGKNGSLCRCYRQKIDLEDAPADNKTIQAIELAVKALGLWQDYTKRR